MLRLPVLSRRGDGALSDATASRHVAAGHLVPVLPGVHLRADVASDPQWLAAAAISWRCDATLVGAIAASQTFWPELTVDAVDVACKTTVKRPGFRFERRTIPSELVVYRGSARLSAPALTALDLAIGTDGASIDNVLRSKMVRIEDLHAALAATPYRSGNQDRRRLLLDSRAEPWSYAERVAHKILHTASIDGWVANRPIVLDGQRYFLDIAFDAIKLVIEIDGREFHTLPDVFETDRVRQNALVLAGWTVLRYTYGQLVNEPNWVLGQIRAGMALARHRAELERIWRQMS